MSGIFHGNQWLENADLICTECHGQIYETTDGDYYCPKCRRKLDDAEVEECNEFYFPPVKALLPVSQVDICGWNKDLWLPAGEKLPGEDLIYFADGEGNVKVFHDQSAAEAYLIVDGLNGEDLEEFYFEEIGMDWGTYIQLRSDELAEKIRNQYKFDIRGKNSLSPFVDFTEQFNAMMCVTELGLNLLSDGSIVFLIPEARMEFMAYSLCRVSGFFCCHRTKILKNQEAILSIDRKYKQKPQPYEVDVAKLEDELDRLVGMKLLLPKKELTDKLSKHLGDEEPLRLVSDETGVPKRLLEEMVRRYGGEMG